MSDSILPSSRLQSNPTFDSRMVDWEDLATGRVVRIEMLKVYCANCGKPWAYVPSTQVFEFYLCRGCFEKYGGIVGTYAMPDDDFARKVAAEMDAAFGRQLTAQELAHLMERGELPKALGILDRESPYRAAARSEDL